MTDPVSFAAAAVAVRGPYLVAGTTGVAKTLSKDAASGSDRVPGWLRSKRHWRASW